MADEFDEEPRGAGAGDTLAAHLALGSAGATEAQAYLARQNRLAELQIENLKALDAYELSHLRWRRFNDQMRGTLQIMLVAIGLLGVTGIAAAMWNASQADGLSVESFSVPPAFAQSGLSGDVIAEDITAKLGTIRDIANGNSLDVSKNVHQERDDDVKVEIPDTGVSLAEAWRYLRAWLGNERRVSGNLRAPEAGRILLTVAMEGAGSFGFEGGTADLARLEQQAAEKLFASVDPINYVLYLQGVGRISDALAAVARANTLVSTPVDRADAFSLWSDLTRVNLGDPYLAMSRARIAIGIDPNVLAAHRELMRASMMLGHDETAFGLARSFPRFRREDQPALQQGAGFDQLIDEGEEERDLMSGDFARGLQRSCKACPPGDRALERAQYAARLHDVALYRSEFAQALAADAGEATFSGVARFYGDAAQASWRAALSDAESFEASLRADKSVSAGYARYRIRSGLEPLAALALAEAGDSARAAARIGATPTDCLSCIVARGRIAALAGNVSGAASWFARAEHDGPSIPYADTQWGEMLLARGDFAGAIAKFSRAHAIAPDFADPIEGWGEALIGAKRSDAALGEFVEASRLAPHWGRLRLKWGEALLWSGRKGEARDQFALAARLFLTAAERAQLARMEVQTR